MLAVHRGVVSHQKAEMPCFAVELEQDIARLEEEASRDELMCFMLEDPAPETPDCRQTAQLDDVVTNLRDQHADASDADSDDGGDEQAEQEVARIQANALLVSQCGRTLQPGAWRGCGKSAWCDREDRHRGLCNHRATIPGPAACPEPETQQEDDEEEEEDEGQDASNMDDGDFEAAACRDVVMQSADEQQLSGGHSHNCQTSEACTSGDEREVASALQTGCMLEFVQHQHSTTQAQLQQDVAAATAEADLVQSNTSTAGGDMCQDLLWGSNGGQLAAAELFSIPAAYQPRVKDLTAPGAPCLLGMGSLCGLDSAMVTEGSVDDLHVPGAFETCSSDCSDHTNAKVCATNSGSTAAPSSPSCASGAAEAHTAVFGPCEPQASPDTSDAAAGAHLVEDAQPAAVCSPCTPQSSSIAAALTAAAADLPAAAHPSSEAASAAAGTPASVATCVTDATVETEAPVVTALTLADSSTQAAIEQAAAEAAATAEAAAEAAAALASSGLVAAPSSSLGLPVQQRPPRIKSKPSNSLMKAAAIMEAACSPKSKKRPAARLASNPSSSHCCTQCGAVSTPVWRAGPAGPKTLCNACGVRYMKVAKRK